MDLLSINTNREEIEMDIIKDTNKPDISTLITSIDELNTCKSEQLKNIIESIKERQQKRLEQSRNQLQSIRVQSEQTSLQPSEAACYQPIQSEYSQYSPVIKGIKHCKYKRFEDRLASFDDYIANFPHARSSPLILAKAGFYYHGPADAVRCYCCDGGLKKFTANDDPFKEHEHYFPRCKYILFIKESSTNIQYVNSPSLSLLSSSRPLTQLF